MRSHSPKDKAMDQFDPRQMAQQNTFWQALKDRMTPTSMGLLGGGAVQNAAQSMQNRPYQIHVQEAMALGQQPMTPEQFMQMQQRQQPRSLL
jgi:hypothetical protein